MYGNMNVSFEEKVNRWGSIPKRDHDYNDSCQKCENNPHKKKFVKHPWEHRNRDTKCENSSQTHTCIHIDRHTSVKRISDKQWKISESKRTTMALVMLVVVAITKTTVRMATATTRTASIWNKRSKERETINNWYTISTHNRHNSPQHWYDIFLPFTLAIDVFVGAIVALFAITSTSWREWREKSTIKRAHNKMHRFRGIQKRTHAYICLCVCVCRTATQSDLIVMEYTYIYVFRCSCPHILRFFYTRFCWFRFFFALSIIFFRLILVFCFLRSFTNCAFFMHLGLVLV